MTRGETVPGDFGVHFSSPMMLMQIWSSPPCKIHEFYEATVCSSISIKHPVHRLHSTHQSVSYLYTKQLESVKVNPSPSSVQTGKKERHETIAQKSVVMLGEKKIMCTSYPDRQFVYSAAAILVKLNSYCPSFMHLTDDNPECSWAILRLYICNSWHTNGQLGVICWLRLRSEINVVSKNMSLLSCGKRSASVCRLSGTTVRSHTGWMEEEEEAAGWASSDVCRVLPKTPGSVTCSSSSGSSRIFLSLTHTGAFLVLSYTSGHQFNFVHPPSCPCCVIIKDVDNDLIQKTTRTVSNVWS